MSLYFHWPFYYGKHPEHLDDVTVLRSNTTKTWVFDILCYKCWLAGSFFIQINMLSGQKQVKIGNFLLSSLKFPFQNNFILGKQQVNVMSHTAYTTSVCSYDGQRGRFETEALPGSSWEVFYRHIL